VKNLSETEDRQKNTEIILDSLLDSCCVLVNNITYNLEKIKQLTKQLYGKIKLEEGKGRNESKTRSK